MIQKLRNKFIIINMTLVSVVLLAVLTVLCLSNYQEYLSSSRMALDFALRDDRGSLRPRMELRPGEGGPREENQDLGRRDVLFVIEVDSQGNILQIDESGMEVDEEAALEALTKALESETEFGLIRGLQLRYKKQAGDNGMRIAFLDVNRELEGMTRLLVMSVLVFVGSILVFLVISIYLARWALSPTEKAWQQQRRFVADASHELKTPLTVILANLGILASHKGDTIEKHQKWLDNTTEEAKRMQKLLEDLLFLAKSDGARTPTEHMIFDLSNTLWSCILPFEPLTYEQEVQMEEEIAQDIALKGDQGQIRQLIAILMDNACKYVEKKGTITVRLWKNQEKIYLSVSNTGTGIPTEEMEHIFERFYRVDKSRARKVNGYGLGLSIADTIIRGHRGKIRVASEGGETTFTVTLPGV